MGGGMGGWRRGAGGGAGRGLSKGGRGGGGEVVGRADSNELRTATLGDAGERRRGDVAEWQRGAGERERPQFTISARGLVRPGNGKSRGAGLHTNGPIRSAAGLTDATERGYSISRSFSAMAGPTTSCGREEVSFSAVSRWETRCMARSTAPTIEPPFASSWYTALPYSVKLRPDSQPNDARSFAAAVATSVWSSRSASMNVPDSQPETTRMRHRIPDASSASRSSVGSIGASGSSRRRAPSPCSAAQARNSATSRRSFPAQKYHNSST